MEARSCEGRRDKREGMEGEGGTGGGELRLMVVAWGMLVRGGLWGVEGGGGL